MGAFKVEVKTKGLKRLDRLLNDSKFRSTLNKNLDVEMSLVADLVRDKMVTVIRRGNVGKGNALLTLEVKGHGRKLSESDSLAQSITSRRIKTHTYLIGPTGKSEVWKARRITQGKTIPVSDEMRRMFKALWLVTVKGADLSILKAGALDFYRRNPSMEIYPLQASTTKIFIPGRPYMPHVFRGKKIHKRMSWAGHKAARDTIKFLKG